MVPLWTQMFNWLVKSQLVAASPVQLSRMWGSLLIAYCDGVAALIGQCQLSRLCTFTNGRNLADRTLATAISIQSFIFSAFVNRQGTFYCEMTSVTRVLPDLNEPAVNVVTVYVCHWLHSNSSHFLLWGGGGLSFNWIFSSDLSKILNVAWCQIH